MVDCWEVAQSAFQGTGVVFVLIEFRNVAGEIKHGDNCLMFFSPGFHRLAVMQTQLVEDEIHSATFHRAHQPLQEPDEQQGIQSPRIDPLQGAPTGGHGAHHGVAETFRHPLDGRRLPTWRIVPSQRDRHFILQHAIGCRGVAQPG